MGGQTYSPIRYTFVFASHRVYERPKRFREYFDNLSVSNEIYIYIQISLKPFSLISLVAINRFIIDVDDEYVLRVLLINLRTWFLFFFLLVSRSRSVITIIMTEKTFFSVSYSSRRWHTKTSSKHSCRSLPPIPLSIHRTSVSKYFSEYLPINLFP